MSPDALDIATSVPNCFNFPRTLSVIPKHYIHAHDAFVQPLLCAPGVISAPMSLLLTPPVCARGCFRSQQPPEALSCMQNRFSMHTTASTNSLLCAPGVISAPMSLLLTPHVCAGGLFCSRVADDYARLESVAFRFSCAKPSPRPPLQPLCSASWVHQGPFLFTGASEQT